MGRYTNDGFLSSKGVFWCAVMRWFCCFSLPFFCLGDGRRWRERRRGIIWDAGLVLVCSRWLWGGFAW